MVLEGSRGQAAGGEVGGGGAEGLLLLCSLVRTRVFSSERTGLEKQGQAPSVVENLLSKGRGKIRGQRLSRH